MLETQKQNILLVDDKPANLVALQAILAADDRNLVLADSGNDALKATLHTDFAVILLDVQMPDMDGFEVAELLRRNSKTSRIPIIFVTAIDRDQKREFRGYDLGAVDFLYKPIDPNIIRSKVRIFCDLKCYEMQQSELMAKMEKNNHRLVELNELKTNFLATASHELRTPLTIIRDFVALVQEGIPGPVNEDQKDCLDSALRNCDRLGNLINDLLDLQKLQSGRMQLEFRALDLQALLQNCHRDMSLLCRARNQKNSLEIPAGEILVCGDAAGLTQVLVNLLGNANKFTPDEGQISIAVRPTDDYMVIDVTDTGPGIEPGDQERIFHSFTQVGRKDEAGSQGTGLGLTIANRIAKTHGKPLTVASTPGSGATFSFYVPHYRPGLELELTVRARAESSEHSEENWLLLLLKVDDTTTGPWQETWSEVLTRKLGNILRGERDEVFFVEKLGLVTVLAPVPSHMNEGFESRIINSLQEEPLTETDLPIEHLTFARINISTDAIHNFHLAPETLEFKPVLVTVQ